MWEISGYNQYVCFLYSVILGAILGFIYDIFKFDRVVFKRSKAIVCIWDILFWIISASILFSFCVLFSNGQIRGYILCGSFLGFTIYKLTFSRLVFIIFKPIKRAVFNVKNRYVKVVRKTDEYLIKVILLLKKWIKKLFLIKKRKNNKIIQKNS